MTDNKVQIKNLYKIFGARPETMVELVRGGVGKTELLEKHQHVLGLNNINLDIPARQVQVIMGLSGSGKSTLIRHINRLIEPTSGEMVVDGENVLAMGENQLRSFRRKKASMVFQKFALLPHRTIVENVAYGLSIQHVAKADIAETSQRWIDRVGLSGFENHFPDQLSGGMQQRVGLARALATDAEILLMDEAFSALDPLIRTDMQNVMLDLQSELHKTIIFITHDLEEALRIGDNIAILRDGIMVQQGSPQEIVMHPVDDYVADFIKDINRARVLEIGSVMNRIDSTLGPEMDAALAVEDAMQVLVNADAGSGIVMRQGKPVGAISMNDMVTAIARPKPSSTLGGIYR